MLNSLPAPISGGYGPLDEFLTNLRGRRICLLTNTGNRGDGLIHLAGRQLLSRHSLSFDEIHESRLESLGDLRGDVLLVFSNGAFCRATHTLLRWLPRYVPNFRTVALLPGSFETDYTPVVEFLRTLGSEHVIFCREKVSFDGLASLNPRARVVLVHDLAFLADLSSWASRPAAGTCGVFRRDVERSAEQRPNLANIHDASAGKDSDVNGLLDYVARFEEIHCDRTHAAVAGALMGRRVVFYQNSYFKNRAIFEHSLRHFPNVSFAGPQPVTLRRWMEKLYWVHLRQYEMKARRAMQILTGDRGKVR